jgi:hypothetical protein
LADAAPLSNAKVSDAPSEDDEDMILLCKSPFVAREPGRLALAIGHCGLK